jgi:hypothetical protein
VRVASTFLTAVNAGSTDLFESCLDPAAMSAPDSILTQPGWAELVRSGNYQVDDVHREADDVFSFGTPDLPPNSSIPPNYVDPGGRVLITVTTKPNGHSYVLRVGLAGRG